MLPYLLSAQIQAPYEHFTDWEVWVGLIVAVVVFGALDVFVFHRLTRNFVRLYIVIGEIAFIATWMFDLEIAAWAIMLACIVGCVVFFMVNLAECRTLTANNLKGKTQAMIFKPKHSKKGEALFDRDLVYGEIEEAVLLMAKRKIGAIIAFEKKDSLTDSLKSGTMVNAPVSAELLQTIFYPGTRLHDGAVIVRNDQILAASVFFTPSTRPLTGKYGSRHRAALGFSEICDAVVVIVSEETGRISIAYEGELQTVGPDEFLTTFKELMLQKEEVF